MVVLGSQSRFVRIKGTIFLLHCIKHKYRTPAMCQHLGHMKFPVEWGNSRVQGSQWDTDGNGGEKTVGKGGSHGHWLKLPTHAIIPAYLLLVKCILCLASVCMLSGAHEVSGLQFCGLTHTPGAWRLWASTDMPLTSSQPSQVG